jgi:hypothetical protein
MQRLAPSPLHLHQPPPAVHPSSSPWPIRPRAGDALDVLTAGVQGQEAAPVADMQRLAVPNAAPGHSSNVQHLAADVHRVAAAPGALAAPTTAPCAMAVPSCALDAQDVAVDGACPTDASAVALARSLMPTVPHPAIEYNLPVLDVQRY